MQRQLANTNMVNPVHSTGHKSNTCDNTALVCPCLEASSQSSQCAQALLQVNFTAHSTNGTAAGEVHSAQHKGTAASEVHSAQHKHIQPVHSPR